ncbi:hypothetical protein [Tardiphaga sp.]|uniref:hypothetical protein n=1 Tax=Tardiphaga sp. TaxID=1926292 RepID=UPI0026311BDC|nr:hypothetical protein [Tardiphaga sp.]
MMHLAAKLLLIGAMSFAGIDGAAAQSLEQFFQGIGRGGQPRRAAIQTEWERISAAELLCIDNRLRRARRSVNVLIDRGIGPSDNRVAGIVSDCRADASNSNTPATPSFNCKIANQPDEMAICSNGELARLDRTVVDGYEHVLGHEGAAVAKGIAEPLLQRRHGCGSDIECIKRVQLTAIAAFQARGAPVQVPAPAQVTARDDPAYVVNGMRLGSSVNVSSPDYLDYACAPSQQYAGFTVCQRQTAERSRRRRVAESAAFLHAADGAVVYINQSLEPVVMDDNDAHDEIGRLSETLGKATLLPMQDARGVPSGLIASWGAVSLQPLGPERRAALAAGTDDQPGILIDGIGNAQRSAQLGLPIYRLGGGAGYVWSASWNGRGRGTLRMLAIDASRLPGAAAEVKPAEPPAVVAEAPKPVDAAPPAPAAATQTAPKPAEPTPVPAPQAKTPAPAAAAPAPAEVRVVGPPIALRPATPAAAPTPTPSGAGNGLVIFLIALVVVLLAAVAYLFRKSRIGPSAAAAAPAVADTTPPPAPSPASVVAPASEKIDLPALVPVESPDSVAASTPDMTTPHAIDGAVSAGRDIEMRELSDTPNIGRSSQGSAGSKT